MESTIGTSRSPEFAVCIRGAPFNAPLMSSEVSARCAWTHLAGNRCSDYKVASAAAVHYNLSVPIILFPFRPLPINGNNDEPVVFFSGESRDNIPPLD